MRAILTLSAIAFFLYAVAKGFDGKCDFKAVASLVVGAIIYSFVLILY